MEGPSGGTSSENMTDKSSDGQQFGKSDETNAKGNQAIDVQGGDAEDNLATDSTTGTENVNTDATPTSNDNTDGTGGRPPTSYNLNDKENIPGGKKPIPSPRSHTEVPGQHSDGASTSNPGKQTENESDKTSPVRPSRKPRSSKSSGEDSQSKTKEEHNPKHGSKETKHGSEGDRQGMDRDFERDDDNGQGNKEEYMGNVANKCDTNKDKGSLTDADLSTYVVLERAECDSADNTSYTGKDVKSIRKLDNLEEPGKCFNNNFEKDDDHDTSTTDGNTETENYTAESTDTAQQLVDTPLTGTTQSTVSPSTMTTQSTDSPLTGTTQSTDSPLTGTTQSTDSPLTGTTQSTDSPFTGSTKSADTPLTGTTQSNNSQSTKAKQLVDTPPTGSKHSSVSPSTRITQSTDTPLTGTTQSTDTSLTGTTQSTVSPSTGTTQSTDSPLAGTTKSADTPLTGTTQSTVSPLTGTTQSTDSPLTGTTQSADTPLTGTTQSTVSQSTGTTQSTVSPSTGTTQSTVSPSTGTTQSTVSPSTRTTKTTDTPPTGTTQSTDTPLTGTTKSTDTPFTGTTQSTVSPSTGTTKSTDTSSTGTTQSINTVPTWTTLSTDTVPTGTTPSTDTVPTGTTPSTDTVPTGIILSTDTVNTGTTTSTDTVPTWTTKSIDTVPTGTTLSTDTVPTWTIQSTGTASTEATQSTETPSTGTTQSTGIPPSGAMHAVVSTSIWTTKSTVSTSTGTTQSTSSSFSGTTQSMISTPTGTNRVTVSTSTGSTHATASKNMTQVSADGQTITSPFASVSSHFDEPVSKQHDVSSDSDVDVLHDVQEEDGNSKVESIPPPTKAMVESMSISPEENLIDYQKQMKNLIKKEHRDVPAEMPSPIVEKKASFELKPWRSGKYLIKSDRCLKPFTYTPQSEEISIDLEENLLTDGDRCFALIVENGKIKLDEIVDAETTNTTPVKTPSKQDHSPAADNLNPQDSPKATSQDKNVRSGDLDDVSTTNVSSSTSKLTSDDAVDVLTGTLSNLTLDQQADSKDEPNQHTGNRIFSLSDAECNRNLKIHVRTSLSKQSGKDTCYTFGCKTMDVYLRWNLALRETSIFKQVVKKLPIAKKYQLKIARPNAALLIEAQSLATCTEEEALRVASDVVDVIVEDTKVYSCEGINLEGDDAMKVLTEIQQSRLSCEGQLVEAYDDIENKLWVMCHPKVKDHVMDLVEKARQASKMKSNQGSETLKLTYFLHQRMNDQQVKYDFKQTLSSVELTQKEIQNADTVLVTLRSETAEALKAAKMWIYDLEQKFAVFALKYSDHEGHVSGDLMTEFLNMSFKDKDIKHETNEEFHKVWIWSSSLDHHSLGQLTSKARNIIKNDKVFKSVSLPIGPIGLKKAIEKQRKKYDKFVQIEYNENEVVISGLCYLVDTIEGELEIDTGSSKTGQNKPLYISADEKQKRFMEPCQQAMDRGATCIANNQEAVAKLSWNTDHLVVFEDHKVLLSVTNIPKNKTRGDLLTEFQCNSKTGPRLVYLEESGKALIIFNKTRDMNHFKDRPKGYQYENETKMGLGNISLCVNADVWTKLSTDATNKLEQDWNDIGVTVAKDNGVLKAPTAYQMGVAKRILDKFIANKERECEIDDVPALVWRTVSALHRQTITDIEKKCGNRKIFSEDEAKVRFPAVDKSLEKCITILRKAMDDMKKKEIIDVSLKEEEMEKGEEACKQMGSECCIFDKTSKTVFIYCDSYDKLQKHKFQFEIKIGRKKTTARGDRSKAQVVDQASDQASSENPNKSDANMHRSALEPKTFITEGIKVMVYKANILGLDVDCIVNAANKHLQHGGGVARVIAKAAGDKFASECKQYIHAHGELPVGQACSTTAGELIQYKWVIHTVGPAWNDYDNKRYHGRKACEDDLMQAVLNSFYEADKLGLKSIALPAISSAIFGVPIDTCVKQYVRAVKEYSNNKRSDLASTLSEIHFIDVNELTVSAIQGAFKESISSGSFYHTKKSGGTTFNLEQKPEPLMCESDLHEYQFYFMGNEDSNMLLLCKNDIEDIDDSSAVVVPVDQYGKGGKICQKIEDKVEYMKQYKGDKGNLFGAQVTVGHVLKNSGYGCGFKFVLYAVYPHGMRFKQNTERERSLANVFKNVLNQADTDKTIQSVVIPLFGIEPDKEGDVQLFSSVFVRTYKEFCDEKLRKRRQNPLLVTVVCHTDNVFKETYHVFADYVKKLKDDYSKKNQEAAIGNNAEPSSTSAVETVDASIETCVICMETVTDPKTLKCGHTFCVECIDQQFKYKKQCPTCGKVCGTITGDQPEGTMTTLVRSYTDLPGYEGCGSIAITYNFQGGRQESYHPSPGTWYKGIYRTAYLPNNDEGKTVLKMLKIAFERKLTFTIGNSRTTGQQDVITWNDIHHKTDHRPNTQFGYPDPTYLTRVKDELAAKGVTEEDI